MPSSFAEYATEDEDRLFGPLKKIGRLLTEGRARDWSCGFGEDEFEFLAENLLVCRIEDRFCRSRLLFCGDTIKRFSRVDDPTDIDYGDLMVDPRYRHDFEGHRHVALTKLPLVTRDQPFAGGRTAFYTRFLVPVIRNGRVDKLIGSVFFHDRPLGPVARVSTTAHV